MEFMEMERQLQDNVTKRLQAILEPEDLLFDEPMKDYTRAKTGRNRSSCNDKGRHDFTCAGRADDTWSSS